MSKHRYLMIGVFEMRLIDADELRKTCVETNVSDVITEFEKMPYAEKVPVLKIIEKYVSIIKNAPTIDAEPVRHGKWIDMGDYVSTTYASLPILTCSVCRKESIQNEYCEENEYCPHCGAKMDLEGVEDDK